VAGGAEFTNEVILDGTFAVIQIGGWVGESSLPLEAVDEFKVQTSGISAEYERTTKSVFNYSLKSSTNKFHGSAYGYLAGEGFNTKGYFGGPKPPLDNKNYGFTLSGPIIKNKTFYFGSYEAFRQRIPANLAPNLPTVNMRQGDFSQLLSLATPITIRNPYTGAVFPGNIIPKELLSATSLKWQGRFFPLPNYGPPDLTVANYRGTYPHRPRRIPSIFESITIFHQPTRSTRSTDTSVSTIK
jgi:hypothetical protein